MFIAAIVEFNIEFTNQVDGHVMKRISDLVKLSK
jgi:hypothetical protein